MRAAILVGIVMLVFLMILVPPVRYSYGGSMEGPPGYRLNTATLIAEFIIMACTAGLFLRFRNRR